MTPTPDVTRTERAKLHRRRFCVVLYKRGPFPLATSLLLLSTQTNLFRHSIHALVFSAGSLEVGKSGSLEVWTHEIRLGGCCWAPNAKELLTAAEDSANSGKHAKVSSGPTRWENKIKEFEAIHARMPPLKDRRPRMQCCSSAGRTPDAGTTSTSFFPTTTSLTVDMAARDQPTSCTSPTASFCPSNRQRFSSTLAAKTSNKATQSSPTCSPASSELRRGRL